MDQGDQPKPPQSETGQASNTPIPNQQQERRGIFGGLFGRPKPEQPAQDPVPPSPNAEQPQAVEEAVQAPSLTASEAVSPIQDEASENMSPTIAAQTNLEPRIDNTQYVPSQEKTTQLIKEHSEGDPAKRTELLTRAAILRPLLDAPDKLGMTDEQTTTIKQYARIAGEKARTEAEVFMQQSPVETVDQILFDLQQQISPHREEARRDLYFASQFGLHALQKSLHDSINTYQQQRDIEGESVTFDQAFDAVTLTRPDSYGRPIQDFYVHLGLPTGDILEPMLKKLGVLKPDQTLDLLKGSSKWSKHEGNGVVGDRLESGIVGGTFDGYGGNLKYLETSIPGLSIGVAESDKYISNFGSEYRVSGKFDRETARILAKAPAVPGVFERAKNAADLQSAPVQ